MIDIPAFLVRKPGDHQTAFTVLDGTTPGIHPVLGPIAKANIERLRKITAREAARATVLKAIKNGADTFGKIRKETGIDDDSLIRSALRRYVNSGRVEQNGRRYHAF